MSDIVTLNGYKIKDEKAVRSYETVASMKADTKLKEGYHVKTKGYYEVNDGGSGEYVIVDDDTLVDDGGSIHVLTNGLRAKLIIENKMNVECFGAKGDDETDDSSAIQTAINSPINTLLFSEKTYLVENNIDLGNHEYIGNNSTIHLSSASSREHFIRNKNFNDITKNDNITIKNIHFTIDVNASLIGLQSATLIMDNCSLYANNYSTRCLLDLYGNNKNCNITNSIFTIETSDLTKRGTCIEIRGFTGGLSKNINVSNCILSQNTLDETLWINAGVSGIEDVVIDNCQLNDTGNGANTLWISNSYSSEQPLPIKNVEIRNCNINKTSLVDRVITIGTREGSSDYTHISVKNISLNGCSINVNERASGSASGSTNIIWYSKADLDNHELTVQNCKINYNGENTINSSFIGAVISKNNIINGTNISYIFLRAYKSLNDIIVSCKSIARDTYEIDGMTATASSSGFLESIDYTHNLTSYLKNSNINCTSVINNSGSIRNRIYHISNNHLTHSGALYNNYNGDTSNKLYLKDNYTSNKNSIVNNQNCSLYFDNNYNNDGLIKGITGFNSYTLGSLVVGTVLFSSTATKSIVRKISEGNTTDNWEEI